MITYVAGIIGAIVTIVSFFYSLYKVAKKIDSIVHSIDENTMYTLKLVILNKELSIEERIHAGDRYNSLGGNGYAKQVYKHLLDEVEKGIEEQERGNWYETK